MSNYFPHLHEESKYILNILEPKGDLDIYKLIKYYIMYRNLQSLMETVFRNVCITEIQYNRFVSDIVKSSNFPEFSLYKETFLSNYFNKFPFYQNFINHWESIKGSSRFDFY